MVALGLVLVVVGALVLIAGIFTTGDAGDASILGIHVGSTTVFLLGFFAGIAIIWGLGLVRFGGKRQLKQRKEKRHLQQMAEKLKEMERREGTDTGEAS